MFEDDPYVLLRFSGETLPTMVSMDAENVVYASSFSKTVCPGIRVGYLVGPPELIAKVSKLATNTYISPSMVSQAIVNEFCRSGAIETSIETVKAALKERAAALGAALAREFPDARFVAPEGGYFLWVEFPRGVSVDALFTAAAARGVAIVKGSDFLLEGGDSSMRLAYSGVTVDADRGGRRPARRRLPRGPADPEAVLSGRTVAPEHKLLGKRDPRWRRRIGEDRDRLGDARRDAVPGSVGSTVTCSPSCSTIVPDRPGSMPTSLR